MDADEGLVLKTTQIATMGWFRFLDLKAANLQLLNPQDNRRQFT